MGAADAVPTARIVVVRGPIRHGAIRILVHLRLELEQR
jgi:hypothetical protein